MRSITSSFVVTSLSIFIQLGQGHSHQPTLTADICLQPLINHHHVEVLSGICPAPLPPPSSSSSPSWRKGNATAQKKAIPPKLLNEPNDTEDGNLFKSPDELDEYQLPSSWQGPEHCIQGDKCMFWNQKVGDGIVVISTPRNAHLAANFPIPPGTEIVEASSFYEKQLPGKGMGLIANRTIRKGEIIMQRTPSLLIQAKAHVYLDREVREKLYEAALGRLPEPTRRKFLRQYGDTAYMKVDKNAFRLEVDGREPLSEHFAVFPDVSRMNHDCRPNIHYRITNLTHTTVAVRDIHPGEELTVSYIYGRLVRSKRQTRLSDSWGFDCTCSQCTLPELESMASDARVREISRLEKEIEDKMARNGGREVKPEMAGRLVKLYLDERLEAYMAPTYTRAALIYSMFGDEEKATEYAREAVAALEREYGSHATDADSMRELLADVRGHWSWAIKVQPRGGGGRNNEK
ncbi:SET domain-containing protein 5 [Cladorrhinum samala]|uniref:SET domain-containing protein 5 n=1 Tax=Cladorrhinum samala TaxID=585594 RepID=A0AAV9HV48_9PEZI|nr:SET domain-containing protein 5 [Cladorrhinum samala]